MLTRNSKLHTDVNTSNIEHVQQIQQQKATGKQSSPSYTPLSKKKQTKKTEGSCTTLLPMLNNKNLVFNHVPLHG